MRYWIVGSLLAAPLLSLVVAAHADGTELQDIPFSSIVKAAKVMSAPAGSQVILSAAQPTVAPSIQVKLVKVSWASHKTCTSIYDPDFQNGDRICESLPRVHRAPRRSDRGTTIQPCTSVYDPDLQTGDRICESLPRRRRTVR